jgi:hypothetical protein
MSIKQEGFKMNHEEAFYEWEQARYGDDSPLSDDDREVWIQGYKEGMMALFEGFIKRCTNE